MLARFRLCTWLPLTQCLLGGVFGVLGAWQRVSALDRLAFFDQPLWNTTARFHVWPLPYKLALSINLPSFLVAALVASPFVKSPRIAEYAVMALSVLLAFPIWRGIGSRLDQRIEAKQISIHAALGGCLAFDAVCVVGALALPGAFGLGPLVWIAGAIPLWRLRVASDR
jgi:hypothetical protein